MASGPAVTSNDAVRLLENLETHRGVLVSGAAGIGKSHLLRGVRALLEEAGRLAPVLSACSLGRGIPLGVFVGALDLPVEEMSSPGAVIDAFSRHRSSTVLLVDDVDHLDDASLWVVAHLIRTTGLPAILTSRGLSTAPDVVRDLYDAGAVVEVAVQGLPDRDALTLVARTMGGAPTPATGAAVVAAGRGNPLHLREIVSGTMADGRLVETPHGWELVGGPTVTPRMGQVIGERFHGVDEPTVEAAAVVAIAGECPADAITEEARRALTRTELVEYTTCGWLRLSHPLDAEYLRSRCSAALWHDLTHEAIRVLRGPSAAERPDARRHADLLALDLGQDIDADATIALAEHALGAFDAHLALRAAEAVLALGEQPVAAHRLAGLADSALNRIESADAHLAAAEDAAQTAAERVSVALAQAQHLGMRHHDAAAALAVIERAAGTVEDAEHVAHLHRAALRWAAVAGMTPPSQSAPVPAELKEAETVMGLITIGLSGVISGPLHESELLLSELRRVPADLLALVPGGSALIELTAVMALSFTGDVIATRRRIEGLIEGTNERAPESVGTWEYALGFIELLSADAEQAYQRACSATTHLAWRDPAGLLPAAQALSSAAALATGRQMEARQAFEAVPEAAIGDPKVVMLRAWADAWQANHDNRADHAALVLVEAARWLLSVQHTFFAGMLAHCAARIGHRLDDAASVLEAATALAGGGLLHLLERHAVATRDGDFTSLAAVATDAQELGLVVTAADSWLWLSEHASGARARGFSELQARRYRMSADRLCTERPGMALWRGQADRSLLLSARELEVATLAARRLTAKEIAGANGVSVNTVTNQLASAFRKLGVNNRAELREVLGAESLAEG
ncbi:helix-turn-helix transcriptional regulator [Ruania halotolerans]|uniref:helix-turn-helix transcriptional regulator n=1 Tax=Ruania halotolerans TaxID=2897773 RepID=UPI001E506272|nr:LuxR C-terminal-related transcriptional regulator [Ruania halotolerans]UFU07343.1 helix-turn-helix transcriptional regulator [Ruania halotolerans]